MGLDFSHCEAHWAYSGFNRFRTRLAAEAGIALNCMEGFAYSISSDTEAFDKVEVFVPRKERTEPKCIGFIGYQPVISWDNVKDDIVPLLNHSDCEGVLTPEECKKVAPRLKQLIENWSDNDRDKINALELARGMEVAAAKNEDLKFY